MLHDKLPPNLRKCPKCDGLLMFNADQYGPYLNCTRCGKHIDLLQTPIIPPNGNPTKQQPRLPKAPAHSASGRSSSQDLACKTASIKYGASASPTEYRFADLQENLRKQRNLPQTLHIDPTDPASQFGVRASTYPETLEHLVSRTAGTATT